MSTKRNKKKARLTMDNPSWESGDGRLLQTGKFSDAQVICGGKAWNLHKNILCDRSRYFEKAFTGKFQEARTGFTELHEQDPVDVGWAIEYIYTSKVPRDVTGLLLDDTSVANTVARLFKIADYLGLNHLGDAVADVLDKKFREAAKEFQETEDADTLDDFITGFFDTAPVAYSSALPSMEKLQKTFIRIFELTGFAMLKDDRIREELKKIPQLFHDVLMSLVKSDDDAPSLVLFDNPPRCSGCRREMAYKKFWPVKWIDKGQDNTILDRRTNEWTGYGPAGYGPAGYCEMCARIYETVPEAFPLNDD